MSVYRALGAILLAVSGGIGAYLANQRAVRTLRQTEAWLALLRYIRTQVDCFALPITQILKGCDFSLLKSCGYVGETPPQSLDALLAHCSIADGETSATVTRFAGEFGRSYREEETKGCAYYCEKLSLRRDVLAQQLPAKRKLNSTLWISGALAIVILLI